MYIRSISGQEEDRRAISGDARDTYNWPISRQGRYVPNATHVGLPPDRRVNLHGTLTTVAPRLVFVLQSQFSGSDQDLLQLWAIRYYLPQPSFGSTYQRYINSQASPAPSSVMQRAAISEFLACILSLVLQLRVTSPAWNRVTVHVGPVRKWLFEGLWRRRNVEKLMH